MLWLWNHMLWMVLELNTCWKCLCNSVPANYHFLLTLSDCLFDQVSRGLRWNLMMDLQPNLRNTNGPEFKSGSFCIFRWENEELPGNYSSCFTVRGGFGHICRMASPKLFIIDIEDFIIAIEDQIITARSYQHHILPYKSISNKCILKRKELMNTKA